VAFLRSFAKLRQFLELVGIISWRALATLGQEALYELILLLIVFEFELIDKAEYETLQLQGTVYI